MKCGTNYAYQNGCRCDDCREARKLYQRDYRKRGHQNPHQIEPGHMPGPWVDDAKCKGMDVDLFFPAVGGGGVPDAVQVCNGCPVRVDCLDYALTHNIVEGIWGGLTGRDRKAIRRKWREEVA
jgi:WhiB family redox-sensing transcriptional regulator